MLKIIILILNLIIMVIITNDLFSFVSEKFLFLDVFVLFAYLFFSVYLTNRQRAKIMAPVLFNKMARNSSLCFTF